jgi:DNA-binding LacI/PurR family transcriptional regulator
VSQSTVSRVLSGAYTAVPIAPETRDRVMRAAETLSYRPHPLARGLRGAGTALLGLIVRDIADPFFAAMLKVIAREARRRGYNLVLGNARGSAEQAQALTQILEVRHCEAILLVGDVADEPRLLADLTGTQLTLVALCQGTRAPGLLTVNADGVRGARLALQHLYALGHRRIALLDAGWIGDAEARRATYRQFAREHDLYCPPTYQQVVSNDPAGGQTACKRLLRLRMPPTAIFASTDVLALGAINGAQASGRRVPHDLSVIGFDDIPLAAYAVPPLTTVRQPIGAMAQLAIDLVLRHATTAATEPRTYSIEPELVIRKSTTPIASREEVSDTT